MAELLRMEGISKRFGTFYANKDVDLDIQEGEVHTLLGENGAGKSTLMNILIGLYQPTEGKIYMHGKEVNISSPAVAVDHRIGMVHQHFMLVEAMTGFENIILGTKKHSSPLIQEEEDRKTIEQLAERYGLEVDLDTRIGEMSIGMQQRIEILKVLFRGADLLILDEPTAVLTDQEVEGLFDIIDSLTSEGKAVIFISHKMREVMRISTRVTVLRAGHSVETLNIKDTTSQELADLMIGSHYEENSYRKVTEPGDTILSLQHINYHADQKHGGLKDISLDLHKGEVLGVAGVDGNGQSQLAQLLSGLITPDSGELVSDAGNIRVFDPVDFITAGLGNVPEDRNKMGLVGDMTIADNLILKETESDRFSYGHGAWLKSLAIQSHAEEMRIKNDIRCTSVRQLARSLSGGNQQKVILARELDGKPRFLVAVHPTRGLDIGAANFIHDTIIEQRDAGCAVLLISADFDEVLKLSDRIAVLFEGEVMGIYPGLKPPIEEISLAMAGQQKGGSDMTEKKKAKNYNVFGTAPSDKAISVMIPVVSVLLALIVGAIIIACLGKNPFKGYSLLFSGALGSSKRLAQTMMSACPLIFTSLAVSFAYKCGVFNLGGEGQFAMGAVAAIIAAQVLPLSGPLGILVLIIIGTIAGALWGLLPGIMKITRGLNELITTIMLNYVAVLFMGYIYTGPFREGEGGNPQTAAVAESLMLTKVGRCHVGVFIAILVAVFIWYVIFKTSFGFKIRAVGMNPIASRVAGFPVKKLMVLSFVISGALAGMGGAVELLGKQYRLMAGFGAGMGFQGVAIALIAQLNPIGSMLVAIFFGVLQTGATAMQVGIKVPTAIIEIIRALIIIFAISGMGLLKLPKFKQMLSANKPEKTDKPENTSEVKKDKQEVEA